MRRWPRAARAAAGLATAALMLAGLELGLAALGVATLLDREDPFRGFSGRVAVFERDAARGVWTSDRPANRTTFNPQSFAIDKPAGGFRVFVLGGSSAYGFPWGAETAFPAILGEALRALHPGRSIEVVNAAGISYASHRLRILAGEVLRHEPDLLVVYGGHNEFIERAFYRSLRSRAESTGGLGDLLHRSHLAGAMSGALHALRPARDGVRAAWVAADDGLPALTVRRDFAELLAPVERRELEGFFEENLTSIVRMALSRGVAVVLCTVPANLRDWKPVREEASPRLPTGERAAWERLVVGAQESIESGRPRQALVALETALAMAPADPVTWFLIGRAQEGMDRPAEARDAYRRALELDAEPVRATPAINAAIRAVARREGVLLADVEALFTALAPGGLVGFGLIEDYVHPTREAHQRIALAVLEVLAEAGLPAPLEPDDVALRFAGVLAARGERRAAGVETATYLYNQGMLLGNQERWVEARSRLEQVVALDPRFASGHFSLASVLLRLGEIDRAELHYVRAEALDPGVADLALAHYNLGVARAGRDQTHAAIRHFERAIDIRPDHADAHNNLGVLLARQKRLAEAIEHLETAVRLRPGEASLRDNLETLRALSGKER